MAMKHKVLTVLGLGHEAVQAFQEGLSEGARRACGTYERWCAKDVLAHIAFWQEHRARSINAVKTGESVPPVGDDEVANAACFAEHQQQSWEEMGAYAERVHRALVQAVQGVDELALMDAAYVPGPQHRPLWEMIVNTAYLHPASHLAQYYVEHGQLEAAVEVQRAASDALAGLEDSGEWKGLLRYNLACVYALAGHAEEAMAELRAALALRPSLVEWSKQDSDLVSLRDRADYQALYAG